MAFIQPYPPHSFQSYPVPFEGPSESFGLHEPSWSRVDTIGNLNPNTLAGLLPMQRSFTVKACRFSD